MPKAGTAKTVRRGKPLYASAKISDYKFRQILGHFVRDHTATQTARETGLSLNSVAAIFAKLRVYYMETGLFTDPRLIGMFDDNEEFEMRFLEFHLARIKAKRGLGSHPVGPDYHICESHWRFHFHMLMIQRPSDAVHSMMLGHLLEIIRICGPIGTKPTNLKEGRLALFRQMDQRLLWLERNSGDYRSMAHREELQSIRAIRPADQETGYEAFRG